MQLSAILLFAVCFQVGATSTYGQATVSFTGKDVPLKTVFASVKKQTGYGVFFENGEAMLQSSAPVTLDLKNVSLEVFLRICLKDQPLEYTMEGKTIFIKKKEPVVTLASPPSTPGDPILQIKGRVTNDKGEPLVNANITVKRTGHGTVTDANGNFYLRNVNSDDVVTVTFIGYKTISMPIKDRVSLTVVMSGTTNDLDKVVVQAYGTTSQRLATGNIGTVSAEQIARQPVMNPLEALQGQVAGVVVTNTSGYANGTVKVEVRGRNTINPNFPSDPLYIIDGVPLTITDLRGNDSYSNGSTGVLQSGIASPAAAQSGAVGGQSPLFSLNPMDIESIEVLKDADATSIYGSRGSNGVILITTKKGKIGKTRLDINLYNGISQVPKYYHMLNTPQYIHMRTEALKNDQLPVDIDNAPDLVVWDTTKYTDWQKFLWGGLGRSTDFETSISGGNNQTTFRIAGGYHYQKDLTAVSGGNNRGSFSFNLNHKSINQRLAIDLSANYSTASSNMINLPGAITLPPNAPSIFDNKGNLNFSGWSPLNGFFSFGSLLQPYTSKTTFLNSNMVITYELSKGLYIKANIGYNNIEADQSYIIPINSQDPTSNPFGSSQFGYSFIRNLIIEPQIQYNTFINKGKLDILGGATTQENRTSSVFLSGNGYNNDALLTSVGSAPIQNASNFGSDFRYSSLFGRINYNWDNKYIINLNARRDGSSKFVPGKQYGNFGSIGIAWIISQENWFKKQFSFISFSKLRASYGTVGGDQIGQYKYSTEWSYGRSSYNNVLSIYPQGHADSSLHWQVNRKTEIALTLGFIKDKVTFDIAYYKNRCNNQLVQFPTPIFTGFGNVTANSPADVENEGWEIILNNNIIENKNFKWSAKFNIGFNQNKLLAYPNLSQSPYAEAFVVGKSLNIKKVLHYTGVNSQTGEYSFEDKNKDGQVTVAYGSNTNDDRYIIDLSPKYDGGFTNNFIYKSWQLSLFFYFKKQKGINAYSTLSIPGNVANQSIAVLSRWQKSGDISNIARFTTQSYVYNSFYNWQYNSDAVYTDASFIRLQNVSLSYMLSTKIIQKYKIETCRIFLQADNLFFISKYNGLDPEVQNFAGLPLPRIITAGISCNF